MGGRKEGKKKWTGKKEGMKKGRKGERVKRSYYRKVEGRRENGGTV